MTEKKIAGVCAGLARYLGWDVTLVRVGFIALIFLHGVTLIAYPVLWLVMPRDDRPPFGQTQSQAY
jgi:phage shock protein PspC (stress-responsive transcriptional regulator)